MPSLSSLLLVLLSVSAVLAGLCISLRTHAYSALAALLDPTKPDLNLGNRDYESILRKSSLWATWAGFVFILDSLLSLVYLLLIWRNGNPTGNVYPTLTFLVVGGFILGSVMLAYAHVIGHLQIPSLQRRDREETEEI